MNEPAPAESPDAAPPAARASNTCLRIALVSSVVFGLVLGTVLFLWSRSEDPAYVQSVLDEVLPSTIPAGYKAFRALPLPLHSLQFVTIVPEATESASGPGGAKFVINVNVIPDGLTPEQFIHRLTNDWLAKDSARQLKIESQSEVEFLVRGEPVKGTDLVGALQRTEAPLRMVLVPLSVGEGWVLVTCMGSPTEFDEVAMRAFLRGIK